MATVEREVGHERRKHHQAPKRGRAVHHEGRHHRQRRDHQRERRGDDAARCAVRPRHVRFAHPQHDVADHHQHVGQRGAEHRHVQQHRALTGQRQHEADDAGHHQRQHRRLAGVDHRDRPGQVAGPRQREQLTRVGVDDGEEARDQPGQPDVVDHRGHRRVAERLDQRVARFAHRCRPAGPGDQEQHGGSGDQQHAHRGDDALGHIAFGLLGLLGGQRHALDGQEEPDRERHRRPDPEVAERQERRRARGVGGRDIGQVRGVEAADRRDREDHQTDQRDGGDHEHDLERFADAGQVDADEQHVRGQVHPPAVGDAEQPERFDVGADEGGDRGRRDRVLDQDRGPGGKPAPGPQCAAREGVAAAGRRQRRGHLGHAQHQGQVHARDHHTGDQQATEPALGQTEVPPRVVAGDHIADTETRQQQPARTAPLQGPFGQVVAALVVEISADAMTVPMVVLDARHGGSCSTLGVCPGRPDRSCRYGKREMCRSSLTIDRYELHHSCTNTPPWITQ